MGVNLAKTDILLTGSVAMTARCDTWYGGCGTRVVVWYPGYGVVPGTVEYWWGTVVRVRDHCLAVFWL